MAQLRAVLATREVPGLLTTSLIGRLPTAMAALAVLLLVRGQGGSYTLAGGLAAAFTVGTAIGQPMLARVVDRRGHTVVLVTSGVVSAAAFVVLAVSGAHHVPVSAVAAVVAGLATPPLEPCLRSLWPEVVGDGELLPSALSLDVGLQEIVFVVGPLLVTGSVLLTGDAGGVVACAVLGLLGTLGFAAMRASRRWRPHPADGVHGSPLRSSALVRIFVTTLACGVPVGALAVVAAAYASGHGGSSVTGWVLAANAVGALASGLLGAVRPAFAGLGVTTAGLTLAVGYLPLALPVPVAAWIALAVVSGLALPPTLTVVFQRIQAICPPKLLTEANAWVVTAFGVGAATAALVAGVLIDRIGGDAAVATVVLIDSAVTVLVCLLARPGRPDPVNVADL